MSTTKKKSQNPKWLKDWDDFANTRLESAKKHPILMPINLDIVDGKLVRNRMKAPQVKKLYANCRDEFPNFSSSEADKVFKEYVRYFQKQDGVEGPGDETALDLHCIHPTWMLFHLG